MGAPPETRQRTLHQRPRIKLEVLGGDNPTHGAANATFSVTLRNARSDPPARDRHK
jgi:hypothetical protein